MSVNALFILIGGIIFLGIAGAYLFEKTRIPDVLILMGLGFILGPVAKLVDPSALRLVSPYFGTLALVVILFEGGLGIDLRQLISQFAPATFLTLFTFVLTMAGIAFLGHQALGLSWTAASILGAILCASPSPSISIPVISRMKIPEKTKTLMVLESGRSRSGRRLGAHRCGDSGANTNRGADLRSIDSSVSSGLDAGGIGRYRVVKNPQFARPAPSVVHDDVGRDARAIQFGGMAGRLRGDRRAGVRDHTDELRTSIPSVSDGSSFLDR
jgi:hypothetical protein